MVGGEYKADGCSTQNEYIEKAIRFYTGYRKTDRNERYLGKFRYSRVYLR